MQHLATTETGNQDAHWSTLCKNGVNLLSSVDHKEGGKRYSQVHNSTMTIPPQCLWRLSSITSPINPIPDIRESNQKTLRNQDALRIASKIRTNQETRRHHVWKNLRTLMWKYELWMAKTQSSISLMQTRPSHVKFSKTYHDKNRGQLTLWTRQTDQSASQTSV